MGVAGVSTGALARKPFSLRDGPDAIRVKTFHAHARKIAEAATPACGMEYLEHPIVCELGRREVDSVALPY